MAYAFGPWIFLFYKILPLWFAASGSSRRREKKSLFYLYIMKSHPSIKKIQAMQFSFLYVDFVANFAITCMELTSWFTGTNWPVWRDELTKVTFHSNVYVISFWIVLFQSSNLQTSILICRWTYKVQISYCPLGIPWQFHFRLNAVNYDFNFCESSIVT